MKNKQEKTPGQKMWEFYERMKNAPKYDRSPKPTPKYDRSPKPTPKYDRSNG
jgi:hypothetical protein